MLVFSIFCTEAKLSKRCTTDIHGPLSNAPSDMAAREREREFYKMDPNQAMEGDSPVAPEVT